MIEMNGSDLLEVPIKEHLAVSRLTLKGVRVLIFYVKDKDVLCALTRLRNDA